MATFDVPTEGGTYRVEASSPKDAYERYQRGEGSLLPPVVPRPGPGENPVLTPPKPSAPTGGEVYVPPETQPRAPRQERPLLAPVFDVIEETVIPPVARAAGRGILPTIGSVAGTVAPAVYPPLSAVPVQARQGIGSMLGTGANMALGIEEPSLEQLALSAVTPGASVQGARIGSRLLPGQGGARAAGILEEARALPGAMRQGIQQADINTLFASARQANPAIPMGNTRAMVQQLLAHEQTDVELPSLQFGTIRNLAQQMDRSIGVRSPQGGTPLAQLDAWRQRVGALIDVTDNSEEQRALRALYGSIMTDLDAAATQLPAQAADQLRQGIAQQRRVFAADDLGQMIEAAAGKERQDGLRQLDVGSILKQLETPRTQQQTMLADFLEQNPQERDDILATLRDMNRRNVKMLPPAGVMGGSMVVGARAGAGYLAAQGLNTLTGTEVIDPRTGAALGAAASQAISRALLTPTGRAFLRQLYEETGTINVTQLLAQFGGQTARASAGRTPLSSTAGFLDATIGLPDLGQPQPAQPR